MHPSLLGKEPDLLELSKHFSGGEKATENALVMDQGQLKVFFPELGQWVVEFHLRFILEKQVPCVLHKNPNIGHSKDIFTHLNKWCARNDETELTFTW